MRSAGAGSADSVPGGFRSRRPYDSSRPQMCPFPGVSSGMLSRISLSNTGNGEVDDDGYMVGGAAALAFASVVGVGHRSCRSLVTGGGEDCVAVHQVDALTSIRGKREGAVIPVGER